MAWLSGWSHRKAVTITGQSGAGIDYQVKLSIGDSAGGDFHLEGNCTNFPQDIVVTDNDGTTLLDHWVEDLTTDPITLWVEVADDLGSNVNVYIYYDKSGESSASNIATTFLLGDVFNDGDYTSNPTWTVVQGTWTAASYYLQPTSSGTPDEITAPVSVSTFRLRAQFKTTTGAGIIGIENGSRAHSYAIYMTSGNLYKLYRDGGILISDKTWTADTNWHWAELTRDSSDNLKFYLDDILKDTVNDGTNTAFDRIEAESHNSANVIFFDSFFVGKFQTTEPAYSSVGSEENPPSDYTYGSRGAYSILF